MSGGPLVTAQFLSMKKLIAAEFERLPVTDIGHVVREINAFITAHAMIANDKKKKREWWRSQKA